MLSHQELLDLWYCYSNGSPPQSLKDNIECLRNLPLRYEHGERKGEDKSDGVSQGMTRFSLSKLSHNP